MLVNSYNTTNIQHEEMEMAVRGNIYHILVSGHTWKCARHIHRLLKQYVLEKQDVGLVRTWFKIWIFCRYIWNFFKGMKTMWQYQILNVEYIKEYNFLNHSSHAWCLEWDYSVETYLVNRNLLQWYLLKCGHSFHTL